MHKVKLIKCEDCLCDYQLITGYWSLGTDENTAVVLSLRLKIKNFCRICLLKWEI